MGNLRKMFPRQIYDFKHRPINFLQTAMLFLLLPDFKAVSKSIRPSPTNSLAIAMACHSRVLGNGTLEIYFLNSEGVKIPAGWLMKQPICLAPKNSSHSYSYTRSLIDMECHAPRLTSFSREAINLLLLLRLVDAQEKVLDCRYRIHFFSSPFCCWFFYSIKEECAKIGQFGIFAKVELNIVAS